MENIEDNMTEIILGDIDITPLLNAKKILDTGINETTKTDIEIAGTIKSFEFCYELSWKIMKRILLKKGLTTSSPRDVFRIASDNNIIKDPSLWFKSIEIRNLTVHTYNEDDAKKVLDYLPTFQNELNNFIEEIRKIK